MTYRIDAGVLEDATFRYFASACAAAARLTPAPPIGAGVDASALMALAVRHRIAAPVLDRLASATLASAPEASRALAKRAHAHRLGALRHARQVTELSRSLTDSGIRHLVIKGAVLAEQLYGDLAARDSKDIDLLIDPRQFAEAEAALRSGGYQEVSGQGDPDHAAKHRAYRSGGIEVEVHSRLLDTLDFVPLPFAQVWERRVTVTLGATAIETLSPVDALLYLCAHGGEHCWFRLKWLQDIARIIVAGEPQVLRDALAIAGRDGYDRLLDAALALVADVLDIHCAPSVRRADDRAARWLVALSKHALAAPAELASEPTLGWLIRRSGMQIGLRREWRSRAAFLRHLFTSPRSFDADRPRIGPRWLSYVGRPIRLLRHHYARAAERRPG